MRTLAERAEGIERGAPRVIQTEEELDQYVKVLFELTGKDDPTGSELLAIELLTMVVEEYENRMHPISSGQAG